MPLLPYSISGGALDSYALLLSYSIISITSIAHMHHTNNNTSFHCKYQQTNKQTNKHRYPEQGSDWNLAGSRVNGQETIFLMIASYRDFQCRETITSAFKKADHPEALYVGAVDQVCTNVCLCTNVCMYVYMYYVYMFMYICLCIYVCMWVYVGIFILAYTYI